MLRSRQTSKSVRVRGAQANGYLGNVKRNIRLPLNPDIAEVEELPIVKTTSMINLEDIDKSQPEENVTVSHRQKFISFLQKKFNFKLGWKKGTSRKASIQSNQEILRCPQSPPPRDSVISTITITDDRVTRIESASSSLTLHLATPTTQSPVQSRKESIHSRKGSVGKISRKSSVSGKESVSTGSCQEITPSGSVKNGEGLQLLIGDDKSLIHGKNESKTLSEKLHRGLSKMGRTFSKRRRHTKTESSCANSSGQYTTLESGTKFASSLLSLNSLKEDVSLTVESLSIDDCYGSTGNISLPTSITSITNLSALQGVGKWTRESTPHFIQQDRWREISIKLWIQEAKNIPPNKLYFCKIYLDNQLYGRTTRKTMTDMLLWGEDFYFNNVGYVKQLIIQLWSFYEYKKKGRLLSKNQMIGTTTIALNSFEIMAETEQWYTLQSTTFPITKSGSLRNLLNIASSSSSPPSSLPVTSKISRNASIFKSSHTNTLPLQSPNPTLRLKARLWRVDVMGVEMYSELSNFLDSQGVEMLGSLEGCVGVKTKEELCTAIITGLHRQSKVTSFLSNLVIKEIAKLDNPNLAFRGNSMATKSMDSYMKLVCEQYVVGILSDFIQSILSGSEDCEVDPTKLNNNNLECNQQNLIKTVDNVLNKVLNSVDQFPTQLIEVFSAIRSLILQLTTVTDHDDLCDSVISASIFLRIICPAIMYPNLFHLTEHFPDNTRVLRSLTLVAKTLQSLANFSLFHAKETYMHFMNSYVEERMPLMRNFLRRISSNCQPQASLPSCPKTVASSSLSVPDTGTPYSSVPIEDDSIPARERRLAAEILTLIHFNDSPMLFSPSSPSSSKLSESRLMAKDFAIIHQQLTEVVNKLAPAQKQNTLFSKLIHILQDIQKKIDEHLESLKTPRSPRSKCSAVEPYFFPPTCRLQPPSDSNSCASLPMDQPASLQLYEPPTISASFEEDIPIVTLSRGRSPGALLGRKDSMHTHKRSHTETNIGQSFELTKPISLTSLSGPLASDNETNQQRKETATLNEVDIVCLEMSHVGSKLARLTPQEKALALQHWSALLNDPERK